MKARMTVTGIQNVLVLLLGVALSADAQRLGEVSA
jgi:hypothetical protein